MIDIVNKISGLYNKQRNFNEEMDREIRLQYMCLEQLLKNKVKDILSINNFIITIDNVEGDLITYSIILNDYNEDIHNLIIDIREQKMDYCLKIAKYELKLLPFKVKMIIKCYEYLE
jgi:hypothetical protein